MTDNDIIKALECCRMGDCIHCPRWKTEYIAGDCTDIFPMVLDLINRQKTEIERLTKRLETVQAAKCVYSYDGETVEYCVQSPCPICKTTNQIRAEAVKEFAESVKKNRRAILYAIYDRTEYSNIVDNLVEEMTEG